MEKLLKDVRYGVRRLTKSPGFAIVVIITLAFGIGVNSTIFSLINSYLFRPLPVKNPEQLVALGTIDRESDTPYELSYPDYLDYREQKDIFADLIAYFATTVSLSSDRQAERIWVEEVTANYFSMLGVEALHGRLLLPEEDKAFLANPVMVLSYKFWQSRFGGDPGVIGRTIQVNRHPVTIVGIAPASFTGTEHILEPNAYVPLNQIWPGTAKEIRDRKDYSFNVIGRLQPGVSVDQAKAAVDIVSRRLEQQYPDTNKGVRVTLVPEINARPRIAVASFAPLITSAFMAMAGLVLLITCANVANLMLSRALSRLKEMGVRSALGASRWRLIRQMLTESVLLAILGGAVGLLLMRWATQLFSTVRFSIDAPINLDVNSNSRVFLFTLLIALLAGAVSGLIPAFQASKPNLQEILKEGGKGSAEPGRHRARNLLVVSQVAVSLILLVCAGLFIRSAKYAEKIDVGFRKENLLMFSMDIGKQGYDPRQGEQFYQTLIDRVKALPGVNAASLARVVPFGYQNETKEVVIDGQISSTGDYRHLLYHNVVGPDYFRTMDIPISQGRDFSPSDDDSSPKVAIINEAMAKRFWPSQDPLDKQFRMGSDGPMVRVVGVTKDTKYMFLAEEPGAFFYLPLRQHYRPLITLHLYYAGDSRGVVTAVRQAVRELNGDLPVYDVKTMFAHIHDGRELLLVRVGTFLIGVFGLLGLLLATLGIYSVISYSIYQRTHEIGIRVALGARPFDILKMVISQGMTLTVIGLVIGLIAALFLMRLLASLLYGVSATDPMVFVSVMLILSGAALLACYLPARRAIKLDPIVALRQE
jgi:predicted permease